MQNQHHTSIRYGLLFFYYVDMKVKLEHCTESSKKEHLCTLRSGKNRSLITLFIHRENYISLLQISGEAEC